MITRRQALLGTLFGAGYVGLRALATGLPANLLLDPRKALADVTPGACAQLGKGATAPQFLILSTSGNGDPINANAPGTYEDPALVHSPDPALARTALTLGGQATSAAAPWAALPQAVLDRTSFWHLMTDTPVHPKEPDVLKLMEATAAGDMLPSILARQLAPCLGTIQAQPISLGASSPSEGLTFGGQALPILPPKALKATLASPAGPLTNLQKLRDDTLDQLYDLYKNEATRAQQAYVDALVTSQAQARNIDQSLLEALSSIGDNGVDSQITAAITLIRMKVTPVIAIHVPFGGDNHHDVALANETAQTVSGVASIASLMSQLKALGLADQVTFASLNVFGRTLGPGNEDGRSHNPNHQVSIAIGKPFRGGVIGGVGKVDKDYGAVAFDAKSGKAGGGGDVSPSDSLSSFGKTLLTACGVGSDVVDAQVRSGTVVRGALA